MLPLFLNEILQPINLFHHRNQGVIDIFMRTGNRHKNTKKFKPAMRITVAASILLMIVLLLEYGCKCIDEKKVIETKKETIEVAAKNTASAAREVTHSAKALKTLSTSAGQTSQNLVKKNSTVTEYKINVFDKEKNYYSNDRVNIRKGAGTDFDRLTTIKRDTMVTVLGETDNGWYQVKYNDEVGYIKSDYLQEQEPGIEYIFAGDSRTVQMSQAVNKVDFAWIAKVGEGYSYFSNEAVPQIDAQAGAGSVIIINYGVNDLYNAEKYIKLINKKVDSWISAGATVYYAAVTPVSNYPTITNSDIEAFNTEMKNGLDSRIGWLDGYSYLQNKGFSTGDGLHYNSDTYKSLYTYYINQVAAQKEA